MRERERKGRRRKNEREKVRNVKSSAMIRCVRSEGARTYLMMYCTSAVMTVLVRFAFLPLSISSVSWERVEKDGTNGRIGGRGREERGKREGGEG